MRRQKALPAAGLIRDLGPPCQDKPRLVSHRSPGGALCARSTTSEIIALQGLAGNRAVSTILCHDRGSTSVADTRISRQSDLSRTALTVQRQFWEYTGPKEAPNDTELDGHCQWHHEPPTGPFQEITTVPSYRMFPVYRRSVASAPEAMTPKAAEPQRLKTHRRMHSVHQSSKVFASQPSEHGQSTAVHSPPPLGEGLSPATPQYPYGHVFELARADSEFARAGSPLLVDEDRAGQGETRWIRKKSKYRCAIGKEAFDKDHHGQAITDEHERFVHALLCIRHEIDHAYQGGREGGTKGHYEQEFVVRTGDPKRARTAPVPASWGLQARPILAYISLMVAQADVEYMRLVPAEASLTDPHCLTRRSASWHLPKRGNPGRSRSACVRWARSGWQASGSMTFPRTS
jgi:hypothetical protein